MILSDTIKCSRGKMFWRYFHTALMHPVFALAVILLSFTAQASDLSGYARVIDGDTIKIGDKRIRLWGIDAPELSEPGGKEAKAFLQGLLLDTKVSCRPRGADRYKRTVAQCFRPRGFDKADDIAWILVLNGYARDWPKYSGGYYGR